MPQVLVPFAGADKSTSRAGWWLGILLVIFAIAGCGGADPVAEQPKWLGEYDFVFISIDTLRADHLGSYGYSRQTDGDPGEEWSLAWLAAHGHRFEHCWAPIGKTMPSLASFWTGLFPLEHGAISNPTTLAADLRHFADVLGRNGYQNHAVVANRALGASMGLARGFDSYDMRAGDKEGQLGPVLLQRAEAAIQSGEKLMVWAHWMSPHQPYTPPADLAQLYTQRSEPEANNDLLYGFHRNPSGLTPELKQYTIDLYDAEIVSAAQRVQEFLRGLDQRYRAAGRGGLAENAVIVFFSDHGEELAERHGYFLHAKSLYSGVLRVPLVILAPGESAAVIDKPIALEGVMPWLVDGTTPVRTQFPASWQTSFYAWRSDQWTLVQNPGRNALGPLEPPDDVAYAYPFVALYNRNTDPFELNDVAALHPQITKRLLQEQYDWFQSLQIREAKFLKGYEPGKRLQHLVDLGYLADVPNTFVTPAQAEDFVTPRNSKH